MMNPEWYGLFSPVIPKEEAEREGDPQQQIGLPTSVVTFSEQLNETLLLPHKQNGSLSDFFLDQLFVCRINSDDQIRVTDRVVLFPSPSKDTRFCRFPL